MLSPGIDARRLERAAARLRGAEAGAAWLRSHGISGDTAATAEIGVENGPEGLQLIYPRRSRDGSRSLDILAIDADGELGTPKTTHPSDHWSRAFRQETRVIIVPDVITYWLLQQTVGTDVPFLLLTRSGSNGMPLEWTDESFWTEFVDITVLADDALAGSPCLEMFATMHELDVAVVAPPDGGDWRSFLRAGRRLSVAELVALVDEAPDASAFVSGRRRGVDIGRQALATQSFHDVDSEGRILRFIRTEQLETSRSSLGSEDVRRSASRLVIRSDRSTATFEHLRAPPGTPSYDRILALTNGTRLDCAPSHASASRWSFASVQKYLAGNAGADGDSRHALAQVRKVITTTTGIGGADCDRLSAFVLLSYVFQAFEELPILIVQGGGAGERNRLAKLLAKLCHVGTLVGRVRAASLVRLADEVCGSLILADPGPLTGPSGPNEIGRFLISSVVPGVSGEYRKDADGQLRPLRTFGPRVVVRERPAPVALLPDEACVQIGSPVDRGRAPAGDEQIQDVVDGLYVWSMHRIEAFARREASAPFDARSPLDVILQDAGIPVETIAAGEAAVSECIYDAEQLMREAVLFCMRDSGSDLSITRVALEAALRGGQGEEFSPERVGRWIFKSGVTDPTAPLTRRRLYGHICRIYRLGTPDSYVGAADVDPLAFCASRECGECRYLPVCPSVVPGLIQRKIKRSSS